MCGVQCGSMHLMCAHVVPNVTVCTLKRTPIMALRETACHLLTSMISLTYHAFECCACLLAESTSVHYTLYNSNQKHTMTWPTASHGVGNMQEKAAGSAAYKAKDFDKAIAHFTAAWELYEKDLSFLTNRAAAHFEKGDYDAVIKDCTDAVDKGRAIMPIDWKMLSRCSTFSLLLFSRLCSVFSCVVLHCSCMLNTKMC